MIGREVFFLAAEPNIGSSGHYTDYAWRRAVVIAEDSVNASVSYRLGGGFGGAEVRILPVDKLFDERTPNNPRKAAELAPELVVDYHEGRIPY